MESSVKYEVNKAELLNELDNLMKGSKHAIVAEVLIDSKEKYITNLRSEYSERVNDIFWIMEKIKWAKSFSITFEFFTNNASYSGTINYKDGFMWDSEDSEILLSGAMGFTAIEFEKDEQE